MDTFIMQHACAYVYIERWEWQRCHGGSVNIVGVACMYGEDDQSLCQCPLYVRATISDEPVVLLDLSLYS